MHYASTSTIQPPIPPTAHHHTHHRHHRRLGTPKPSRLRDRHPSTRPHFTIHPPNLDAKYAAAHCHSLFCVTERTAAPCMWSFTRNTNSRKSVLPPRPARAILPRAPSRQVLRFAPPRQQPRRTVISFKIPLKGGARPLLSHSFQDDAGREVRLFRPWHRHGTLRRGFALMPTFALQIHRPGTGHDVQSSHRYVLPCPSSPPAASID